MTIEQQSVAGIQVEHTDLQVHMRFNQPRRVLSSAVLNGGLCQANHLLNLKVPKNSGADLEDPATTLARHCQRHNWQGKTIGMMTAASMKSLRLYSETLEGVQIMVATTTGIGNARRAGDQAEYRAFDDSVRQFGTINTVVATTALLSDAAMVETHMIATEAKVAILQELSVMSAVSDRLATGTGTDVTAIVSGNDAPKIHYAGKHTLFGEKVAQLTMQAIADSLAYKGEERCG